MNPVALLDSVKKSTVLRFDGVLKERDSHPRGQKSCQIQDAGFHRYCGEWRSGVQGASRGGRHPGGNRQSKAPKVSWVLDATHPGEWGVTST